MREFVRRSIAVTTLGLLVSTSTSLAAGPVQFSPTLALAPVGKTLVAEKPFAPYSQPAGLRYAPPATLGQGYQGEVEPNGSTGTASPFVGTNFVVRANLWPAGDIDFYSFSGNAGDRVYAATMTVFSSGNSQDSQITLLDTDGTTVLEFDDDNGSFGSGFSSSIAGAVLPTTGTYFLRVNDFTAGTGTQRGYELHFRLQSGAPTPEVEPNDTPGTPNPLPTNGWVSGTRNPAAATEQDWFSLNLNAGDTVFLSLDLDPEDDLTTWNGRLGFALFGDASNQILVVDDAGGAETPNPLRPSEAMFITVKNAGTYFAFVDSATPATGGPTATYHLSVSVRPATNEGVNCTTYTSTDVPKTIGPGTGLVSSVITVPGNPRIADLDVDIVLNHALMQDVDAHLRSPAGNDNGLFSDIGVNAINGQAQMDTVFDDEAGLIPWFTAFRGLQYKPENNSTTGTASTSGAYRLAAFDGENAGGTWTLDLRDDTAGANGGTLTSWALRICEPPPPPACAPGFVPQTVFSTDFESGAAGFTHSGTQDEWELGLPATVATTTANPVAGFNTCNSGVSCWKTDLDNTYNASSTQDLLSPAINLAGLSAPVVVTWAQRHQVEIANFDHMFVDFQQVGGATPVRLYEWLDPTPMSASAGTGNPQVNIGGSYGWGLHSRRADSLAGLNTELRFHLDSDSSVQFAGLGIDDVSVTACRAASADLSITKTDGVTTAVPGSSVTYTITASNSGTDPATATVADTFPAILTCNWSCVGAGGGTCTSGPVAGNINDAVSLPVGGSVTYTASCTVAASATGTLSNTATVSSAITDPNPANNSATDSDTLTPQADLGITKTDGVTTAVPGNSVTYTITASNPGPSNAPGSTVADTFPAPLTCNWSCVGAGGGTCTGAGSGNINNTANLPAGGSVTYTANCTISGAATGTLTNTATVAAPAGVTDPTPGNNSATDTDTLTPQANLSITKTDGVTTVIPGGSTTYTIVASNAGPSNAPGSTVADTFPATLTCSTTCVGAGGGTCTAGPTAGNINDSANLPSGGSATYTSVCTISGAATGTLTNTATVAAPAGVTDPTPGDNSATDSDTVSASDVSITKTDGTGTVTAGGSTTYTIVVTNNGPGIATNVAVGDTFPAFCSSANFTSVAAGGATGNTAGPQAGNIGDTLTMPVGSTVTYTANCNVAASATGTLVNTATATLTGDTNPGNNSATDTDSISLSADLSITKTDSLTNASLGQTITYTIVASNVGPSNATATVTDNFPAGLTGATWSCAGAGGGICTGGGAGNINDAVTIPVGGSVTYTVNGTASASGALSNTATVAASGGATDPSGGNNSATDTTQIGTGPSVTGTKTVSGIFEEEEAITYTIVLTNNGAGTQGDNAGDEFTDTLPLGLTLVGASATSGTASTAGNTVTWNGSLAGGASVTITIDATIDAGTDGVELSNQGTISYDPDGNGTNDANNVTDDPGPGGAADPTVLTVGSGPSVLEIPTLSPVGGTALFLAFALLSLFAIRRRRSN